MHYFDIIIVVVLLASAIDGAVHGFILGLCQLAGLVAGFIMARHFFLPLSGYLSFFGGADWLRQVFAFLLILIVVSALFGLLGKALRGVARKVFMGWLDRLLGAVFGIVRGVITVLLLTMIMLLTPLRPIVYQEAPHTVFLKPTLEIISPFLEFLTREPPPLTKRAA